ncbi:MAG TPA: hypothetical protein VGJ87_01780 [Roseiflexaceae bacterium]|jgi:hypothetical protein
MTIRYSSAITAILFTLVLAGMIFGAQPAQGYSTPPPGIQSPVASNIHYSIDADPSRIAAVSFTLPSVDRTHVATTVRVKLDSTWYACAWSGASWRCETPAGPAIALVEQLQVAVGQ